MARKLERRAALLLGVLTVSVIADAVLVQKKNEVERDLKGTRRRLEGIQRQDQFCSWLALQKVPERGGVPDVVREQMKRNEMVRCFFSEEGKVFTD